MVGMKELRRSDEISFKLKMERGVSFDEIVAGRFLGIEESLSREHQWLMIFEVNGYTWVAPYVDAGEHFFLKTAFPSRKHTKIYLEGT